jgi:hypothetical protein
VRQGFSKLLRGSSDNEQSHHLRIAQRVREDGSLFDHEAPILADGVKKRLLPMLILESFEQEKLKKRAVGLHETPGRLVHDFAATFCAVAFSHAGDQSDGGGLLAEDLAAGAVGVDAVEIRLFSVSLPYSARRIWRSLSL